jgi:hypothetical protein
MRFIRTYHTREAFDRDVWKSSPMIAFIVETGEVIFLNERQFSEEFSDEFDVLDTQFFKDLFPFYDTDDAIYHFGH